jgi:hypothetical protein
LPLVEFTEHALASVLSELTNPAKTGASATNPHRW